MKEDFKNISFLLKYNSDYKNMERISFQRFHPSRGELLCSGKVKSCEDGILTLFDVSVIKKIQRRNDARVLFREDLFCETRELLLYDQITCLPTPIIFKVVNLSASGICLESKNNIKPTFKMFLNCNLEEKLILERIYSEILRKTESSESVGKTYTYGCAFRYVDEKTKENIRKYVFEKESSYLRQQKKDS